MIYVLITYFWSILRVIGGFMKYIKHVKYLEYIKSINYIMYIMCIKYIQYINSLGLCLIHALIYASY